MPDPAGLTVTLRDGTPVLLRQVQPSDRRRFSEGLKLMSMESRYLRFFSPLLELSEKQLKFLTEVDQSTHVAWGALNPAAPEFPGFGVARYVRLAEDPTVAEVAVAVIDDMHRRGLGSLLLGLLYVLAGEHGVRTFLGTISPANDFLVRWARSLGAKVHYEDGLYRVEVPVVVDQDSLPATAEGDKFRDVLDDVRAWLN